ncbi:hypothetical protein BC835DRAFT_1526109 [Cytidiella melzeri]|nr:hypothetical protein BC835DRAFT_1526109 [Cytidiella melzeri]
MAKPLDILKKGLKILQSRVEARRVKIAERLVAKKPVPSEDEEWLDKEANLIEEQRAIEILEDASDYERGLETLDASQQEAVQKLRELAGDIPKSGEVDVRGKWKGISNDDSKVKVDDKQASRHKGRILAVQMTELICNSPSSANDREVKMQS